MRIFTKDPNFKFMKNRYRAFLVSGLIIIAGIVLFTIQSFNLGIDFTGGTMIEISFKDNISTGKLRTRLKDVGLGKSMIQRIENTNKFFIKSERIYEETEEERTVDAHVGFTGMLRDALMSEEEKQLAVDKIDLNDSSEKRITDFLVENKISLEEAADASKKLIELSTENPSGLINNFGEIESLGLKNRIVTVLKEKAYLGNFIFLSTETVGPQVGHDMRGKVTRAAVYALLGMLIYIGFRFRFIYGVAAVITLIHDVLITLTLLLLFQVEVNLSVVAAILTIVGYSLNDTIVIFDRVRDNVKQMRKQGAEVLLDTSINQTLSRTIVTSGTTLCTVLALFFFGGEVIHAFSFTLMIGVIVGTYSSIFQSCAWLKIWEKKLLGRKKS